MSIAAPTEKNEKIQAITTTQNSIVAVQNDLKIMLAALSKQVKPENEQVVSL